MLTEGFIKLCFCLTYSDELTDRVQDKDRVAIGALLREHGVRQGENVKTCGLSRQDGLHRHLLASGAKQDSFGTKSSLLV